MKLGLVHIVGYGLAAAFIIAETVAAFRSGALKKKQADDELAKLDKDAPEPTAVFATAVNKICDVGDYSKVLFPSAVSEYAVFFRTDDGGEVTLAMSEDEYLAIEEGSHGLLVYQNTKFMAFDVRVE